MNCLARYDRTIFYNPSNKYCVIRMKTSDAGIPPQARSKYKYSDHQIRFVAVGYELPLTDKVSVMLDGEWKQGKYGYQLQVEKYEEIVPQTREGVQGYLSSRLIKGIGEKTAELIVNRFGADALKVLENEPERLLEIRGITPDKLKGIQTSYMESRALRDLMILLSPFHVTPATAMKIYEYFGAASVEILKKNPYKLCQVSGFGFKRVDSIVRKGETPLNSPVRIHGAIYAALDSQKSDGGHLFLKQEILIQSAHQLLNNKLTDQQSHVTIADVSSILEDMILKGEIVSDDGKIYLRSSFVEEDETARQIAKIALYPKAEIDIDSILKRIREDFGIPMSQRQSEAVYMAFRNNLSIITGPPGSGKTTILRAIIEVFKRLFPDSKILLTAPTGVASHHMEESTKIKAKTLHSHLGLIGTFRAPQEENYLEADLIIVDETSMVDMWLAKQFFLRIRPGTKVILVGDVNQLQSVGAGDVFRELINCGIIPVTVLDEIFRQKEGSLISKNAKLINEDNTSLNLQNDIEKEEFVFLKAKTQDETADQICQIFCDLARKHGIDHVQILSPFRSEGAASSDHLNQTIREIVNPSQESLPDLKIGKNYFRLNDKVMQNKNNAKASNGDIGFIRKIDHTEDGELKVTIEFSENRTVEYGIEDMQYIELAYATTIHKAMGSEYNMVILPVIRNHMLMLTRNLIYTAVTRAKEEVVLVGQKWVLFQAIHKTAATRNTLLGKRICNYANVFAKQENLKKAS